MADAGGPYAGNQGAAIALSGAGSTDADGSIVSYEWDCGNDGTYEISSSAPTGDSCSYGAGGTYTVGLRVTDDAGATATDTATITVDGAPTADAGGPYSVGQTVALTVDGSGSSDAEGAIASYAWDCTTDGVIDAAGPSATATCTYGSVQTATLTLVVTDSAGQTATTTTTVTVTNAAPTANAAGPYTGTKNVPVALNGSLSTDSDGTLTSYAWDCTNDGTIDVTSANPTGNACTYPAVAVYTVSLTVTDSDGATSTATTTVTVGNDPPIANAGGPYSGNEGTPIALDGSGSSDPGGAITAYVWDCETDGVVDVTSSNPSVGCTYPDQGTYTATLTVVDDDFATATSTATVTVSNIAPVIGSVTVPSGDEGSTLTFSATAGDAAGDTITYSWDFGDGGSAVGQSVTWSYSDDGSFTVTLTASDDDGASSSSTGTATIANVAPTFSSVVAPTIGDEGLSTSFSALVADAGTDDLPDLVITWAWGDGTADSTGATPSHTWADDGTYTITVSVDDQDGGVTTQTETITIGNIDPSITSSAPTSAVQGAQYSYTPSVVDPGDEVFTWTLSPSASTNTVFSSSTGALTWTPDSADVAQGTFSLVLTVDDGDGGTDAESWTVTVLAADTDGDGMSDDWETANNLDPLDPNDAGGDPDGDGATNLDEFGQGTDPFSYDGPSAPVAVSPLTGDEVADARPDLVVDNALDPQPGDALLYTFEVYSDAALTTLVTSVTGLAEDGSGQTTWQVDVPLTENTEYWWRAAATDPWVTGAFSVEESFFVNAQEEAPSVPALVYPIGDEIAATLTPTLSWTEPLDPDGDLLTYDVEVFDEALALVASTTGVVGDGTSGEWTVDVALAENAFYTWTVRAEDDEGLTSDWAAEEGFFVSEANEAPTGTVFVAPLDGQSLVDASPDLVATEAVDPEGAELTYTFEVDSLPSFDSGDYATVTLPHNGSGEVVWSLSDDGVVLPENSYIYARVRAVDADGISSVPDAISFFVRGDNDAPGVPVLVSPEDGATGIDRPTFVVEDPTDSESDPVRVEFVVARDEALTDIVATSDPIITLGGGETDWTVNVALSGDLYWSARAIDDGEAASDWAAPWLYSVEATGDDDDASGDDDDDDVTDCACGSSVVGDGAPAWGLLLLPLLGFVRRRRR